MTAQKCGNCKWWGHQVRENPALDPENQTGELRQCGRIPNDDGNGYEPPPSDLAFTKDASGYFAALKTREAFGCVLFEQKETV